MLVDAPKVPLKLVGLDGNAFAILGAFRHAAARAGWTEAQIEAVETEAMSGNYDHLLQTIMNHVVNPCGDMEEDD